MAKKKSLKKVLGKSLAKKTKKKGPVWRGPEVDGITQSLLGRFLVCRERFRILVIEGLKPTEQFRHAMEYGNMWHECEEAQGMGLSWMFALNNFSDNLCKKYPLQREQITHWYKVCQIQFPIYLGYWQKNGSKQKRTPLLREVSFKVFYTLPSGRVVLLRGKWDGVDLLGSGKKEGIWLVEHKTKGQVNEEQLNKQLQFHLQTMLYLVALQNVQIGAKDNKVPDWLDTDNRFVCPIKGVLYNVVRRPLSGGKGSIRRHKATKTKPEETQEHYYGRVKDIIAEEPETYFMCWQVTVTQEDIEKFKREFLNPILEQLCDWWHHVTNDLGGLPGDPNRGVIVNENPFHIETQESSYDYQSPMHWRTPYGFYNILAEGGSTELDEYLASGSTSGLQRTENLFPELEEQSGKG